MFLQCDRACHAMAPLSLLSTHDYCNLNQGSCPGRGGLPSGCSRTPRAVPSGAQQEARRAAFQAKFNSPESLSADKLFDAVAQHGKQLSHLRKPPWGVQVLSHISGGLLCGSRLLVIGV